jgi:hypothetical protein
MAEQNATLRSIITATSVAAVDQTGEWIENENYVGAHVVIELSDAEGSTSARKFSIEGKVPGSTSASYDLLVSAAITADGYTVMRVHPSIAAASNTAARDFLPTEWRVTSTAVGAEKQSYRVDANLLSK